MQLKLFDPTIALLISLGTYFLGTSQWDLFLFLMWGTIKYNSQMIFLAIFDLFMLSSFKCFMIFNKGILLISQHNFTASAIFLQLLPLLQDSAFILHYLKNTKIIAPPAHSYELNDQDRGSVLQFLAFKKNKIPM